MQQPVVRRVAQEQSIEPVQGHARAAGGQAQVLGGGTAGPAEGGHTDIGPRRQHVLERSFAADVLADGIADGHLLDGHEVVETFAEADDGVVVFEPPVPEDLQESAPGRRHLDDVGLVTRDHESISEVTRDRRTAIHAAAPERTEAQNSYFHTPPPSGLGENTLA